MARLNRPGLVLLWLMTMAALYPVSGEADYVTDNNRDGKTDLWYYKAGGLLSRIEKDKNFDGLVDNLTLYNDKGQKDKEEYDFNYDGRMDDFYFFDKGMLVRREIDSNYDNKIDVWVFLIKGVYIKKIERDKDFDGLVDYTKEYK